MKQYYNRVETEREIPIVGIKDGSPNRLECEDKSNITMEVVRQSNFEEFQYGKETVQTTTNKSKIKEWEVKTLLVWLW